MSVHEAAGAPGALGTREVTTDVAQAGPPGRTNTAYPPHVNLESCCPGRRPWATPEALKRCS